MEKEERGYKEKDVDLITSQVPQCLYKIFWTKKIN